MKWLIGIAAVMLIFYLYLRLIARRASSSDQNEQRHLFPSDSSKGDDSEPDS